MQAQMGEDVFVLQYLQKQVVKTASLVDEIMEIRVAHVSFTLLMSCPGAFKFNCVLHTPPLHLIHDSAEQFDRNMEATSRRVAGNVLSPDAFREFNVIVSI